MALAVVGLVGCSSDSGGSDGSTKPSTTARSSASTSTTAAGSTPSKPKGDPAGLDATGVQAALVAAGIKCAGVPKAYDKPKGEPMLGADPDSLLGCKPGPKGVQIRIIQWATPDDRAKAMKAASDLVCSFGVVNVGYVAAGPWAIMVEKDNEPVVDLVDKAGEAVGVKPTIIPCETE